MPPSYREKQSGQTVEYMPDIDTDRLTETLIAFANSDGGTVLVGVDERGQINQDLMQEEIEDARAVLEVWAAAQAEGKGVAELEGRLIENLHAAEAERVLAFAEALARRADG